VSQDDSHNAERPLANATLIVAHPGDVANTEAIKAGHTGWYQAGVAAQNIVRMVKDGDEAELEVYKPTKPMIKVSVGKVGNWSKATREPN
jgi:hypothetical protein